MCAIVSADLCKLHATILIPAVRSLVVGFVCRAPAAPGSPTSGVAPGSPGGPLLAMPGSPIIGAEAPVSAVIAPPVPLAKPLTRCGVASLRAGLLLRFLLLAIVRCASLRMGCSALRHDPCASLCAAVHCSSRFVALLFAAARCCVRASSG